MKILYESNDSYQQELKNKFLKYIDAGNSKFEFSFNDNDVKAINKTTGEVFSWPDFRSFAYCVETWNEDYEDQLLDEVEAYLNSLDDFDLENIYDKYLYQEFNSGIDESEYTNISDIKYQIENMASDIVSEDMDLDDAGLKKIFAKYTAKINDREQRIKKKLGRLI